MGGLILLGVLALIIFWLIALYNGLVTLRQRSKQAYADITVQLKQRHDLIPNLVKTVKGYAGHEKGTLEAVIKARNAALSAACLLYTSPSPRDRTRSRMPSSA